jgi:hypothetical protein
MGATRAGGVARDDGGRTSEFERGWMTLHGGVCLDSVHLVEASEDHRIVRFAGLLYLGYSSIYIHAPWPEGGSCRGDSDYPGLPGDVSQRSRSKYVLMLQGSTGKYARRIHRHTITPTVRRILNAQWSL